MNIRSATLIVTLPLIVGALGWVSSASADELDSCDMGGMTLLSSTIAAGESGRFSAWDEIGICSGLHLESVAVEPGLITLDLRAAPSGPAACSGNSVGGELPRVGPGSYTVRGVLTVEDPSLPPLLTCLLGEQNLTVVASTVDSMVDNAAFERGLDGWSASAGWTAEGIGVRAAIGYAELAQCVPVASLAQYRVVVSARGENGPTDLSVGALFSQGACPSAEIDSASTFQQVGGASYQDVELLFSPPAVTVPPDGDAQMYARIVVVNEVPGSALLVNSVRLERIGCGEGLDTVACAHGGRFEIRLTWEDFAATTGSGHIVTRADDSSLWWFFVADNWEMLVKVLRGCGINRHWWAFAAGATNVAWTLDIEDTSTGATWHHQNPLGQRSPAITETAAFDCAAAE